MAGKIVHFVGSYRYITMHGSKNVKRDVYQQFQLINSISFS